MLPPLNWWAILNRPSGTRKAMRVRVPTNELWAILNRPSGTRNAMRVRVPTNKLVGYSQLSLRDSQSYARSCSLYASPSAYAWVRRGRPLLLSLESSLTFVDLNV